MNSLPTLYIVLRGPAKSCKKMKKFRLVKVLNLAVGPEKS